MSNTNCLEGMLCPECGSEEPFRIAMSSLFEIYDDGTEAYGDTEWDDDSYCQCVECGFDGIVARFRKTRRRRAVACEG
jgi:hypothetical protein